jgi:phage tail-like protein
MASVVTTERGSPISEDALTAFNFELDVSGMAAGFFTEISGIGSESEVVESKAMGSAGKQTTMKQPGRLKWNDITLKRGITSNMDMWTWRAAIENGEILSNRFAGSIYMLDQTGTAVAQWDFTNAWPSKVSGPAPKSDGNEVGVEEFTMVVEYIYRVS